METYCKTAKQKQKQKKDERPFALMDAAAKTFSLIIILDEKTVAAAEAHLLMKVCTSISLVVCQTVRHKKLHLNLTLFYLHFFPFHNSQHVVQDKRLKVLSSEDLTVKLTKLKAECAHFPFPFHLSFDSPFLLLTSY